MKYRLIKTPEYQNWFTKETDKSKVQINERLSKVENEGYFGYCKNLGEVFELKWKNGRRVYYALIPEENVLILLGGNKNGQSKDIKESKNLLKKYTENED